LAILLRGEGDLGNRSDREGDEAQDLSSFELTAPREVGITNRSFVRATHEMKLQGGALGSPLRG